MVRRVQAAKPNVDNEITARKGHFSRLYFKDQGTRVNLDHLGTLEKTDYEGKRYFVPDEAINDTMDFKKIDQELRNAWAGLSEHDPTYTEQDIRLLREIQWAKEGSDYKYRYWLQREVEMTSTGQRSLKILLSLNEELENAEKTWTSLSQKFGKELFDLIEHMKEISQDKSLPLKWYDTYAINRLHPNHSHFEHMTKNQSEIEIIAGPWKGQRVRPTTMASSTKEINAELIDSKGVILSLSQKDCNLFNTPEAKAQRIVNELSKATIKVLFQTINKTQRTLRDACHSLNKKQLVDHISRLHENYDSHGQPNHVLEEALVGFLESSDNADLVDEIHQQRYSFSQTPSAFLLKLYPEVLNIVNPPLDYFGSDDNAGNKKEQWAIKISRYLHFLLCRMDWVRINIASPSEAGHYLDESVDQKQISLPSVHRLSPGLLQLINNGDDAMVRQFQRDPSRTMYCYPKPHTHEIGGGYHTRPKTRSGDGKFRKLKKTSNINFERFEPSQSTLEALNHLQKTQWSINLDLLHHIAEFTYEGKPTSEELNNIRYAGWVKTSGMRFKHWIANGNGMNLIEIEETPRVKNWYRILNSARKNMLNGGNVFWHAWWCDYRGRFGTRSPNLGPQGDDLSKALLLFTEWKPLGDRGRYWFYVKIFDFFNGRPNFEAEGTGKKTFDEKYIWTVEQTSRLLEIGKNPKSQTSMETIGLDTQPTQKSETFQRFAALLEFCRIHEEYNKCHDWNEVASGFPVHLDASCNGFQHMSALLRNKDLAQKVNVIKGDKIGDLYQAVADKAQETLKLEHDCELSKFLINELDAKPNELHLWGDIFTRSLCKKPVMITAYGAPDVLKELANRNGSVKYINIRKLNLIEPKVLNERVRRNTRLFDAKEKTEIRNMLKKYESLGPFQGQITGLSDEEKILFERLKKKLDEEGKGIYSKMKKTIHPESMLYLEMSQMKETPQGWDQVFFKWNEDGQPDDPFNALRCIKFASAVANHLRNAIRDVTGDAHKIIQDNLNLLYSKKEVDYFNWNVEDESSRIRIIKLSPKPNPNPSIRTITPYNDTKKYSRKTLYVACIEMLKKNETILGLDENKLKKMEEQIKASKDGKKPFITQSKASRNLRSDLMYNLIKLSNHESKKDLNRSMDIMVGTNKGYSKLEKIQNLIVGIYDTFSIDVPFIAEPKARKMKRKEKTSLTPNFIHSFDAKHMENVILTLSKRGVEDFWAVHDSYGVHACNVDLLFETVREEFSKLHENDFISQFNRLKKSNNVPEQLVAIINSQREKFSHHEINNTEYLIS